MRTEAGTWNNGWFEAMPALPPAPLERAACLALLAFAAALQVSIAARRHPAAASRCPVARAWSRTANASKCRHVLAARGLGAATLVAAVFSIDPRVSLVDSKQLVLLVIVPLAYRLLRGRRALLAVDVIISVGAISATCGIVQYLILNFDHLGRVPRARSALHDVLGPADAGGVRGGGAGHVRAAPSRVGGVGAAGAAVRARVHVHPQRVGRRMRRLGLLFLLRDFRLMALVPVALAAFLAFAPAAADRPGSIRHSA